MNHQIQIYQLKYIIRTHTRPTLSRIKKKKSKGSRKWCRKETITKTQQGQRECKTLDTSRYSREDSVDARMAQIKTVIRSSGQNADIIMNMNEGSEFVNPSDSVWCREESVKCQHQKIRYKVMIKCQMCLPSTSRQITVSLSSASHDIKLCLTFSNRCKARWDQIHVEWIMYTGLAKHHQNVTDSLSTSKSVPWPPTLSDPEQNSLHNEKRGLGGECHLRAAHLSPNYKS